MTDPFPTEPPAAPVRRALPFSPRRLDRRAVSIVRTLQEAGHEAYLVGGCVRDLLLGERPKDWDVATSARPRQVARLFRRSRVLGRRFRLVHVYRGREIFEVATFRRTPPGVEEAASAEEVEVVREDNAFGTAREDAWRRDFTVNALFLDPVAGEILDWTGGLADLDARRLRTVGDADFRFREDPVRILRLIKFMRRLDLDPGPEEVAAATRHARELAGSAPPRVAEELFRLMRTGQSEGVLDDLLGLGVLDLVLPELEPWYRAAPERLDLLRSRLAALDDVVAEGVAPDYALSLAVLFGPRVEEELDPERRTLPVRELPQVPATLLRDLQGRARLPRASIQRAIGILLVQLRMDPPPWFRARRGRRRDPLRIVGLAGLPEALDYLRIRLQSEGRDLALYDEWHEWGLSQGMERR